MNDEVLDLLARGIAQGLGAAEVGAIRLNEVGVELMLADELAQPVANPRPITIAPLPGYRLSSGFLDFGFHFTRRSGRSGQAPDGGGAAPRPILGSAQ